MPSTTKENNKEDKSKGDKSETQSISQPEYKFKNTSADPKIKQMAIDIHTKNKNKPTLPSMVEAMKKDFDLQVPRGWVVFAGKHMAGACSYIQGTMLDFEYDGTAFVIFQTFCPE